MANIQEMELRVVVKEIFAGLELARRRVDQEGEAPEYAIVSAGDIDDGHIRPLELLPQRAFRFIEGDEIYAVRAGDLLVTARGTQFKVGLVQENSAGAIATSTLIVIRPRHRWMSLLLFVLLQSPRYQEELRSRARKSTSTLSWTVKDVASLAVPALEHDLGIELARLVELSEEIYLVSAQAAQVRREAARSVVLSLLVQHQP